MQRTLSDVPSGIAVTFFVCYPPALTDVQDDTYPGGGGAALREYWKGRGVRVVPCRSERQYMASVLAWLVRPGRPDPRSYLCLRRLIPHPGEYIVAPLEAWRVPF